MEHYKDLVWELRKIWNIKIKVISLVTGALGTRPMKLRNWLKKIEIWNSDNRVAENCPPTHCTNPLINYWGLKKLIVTGSQEHKSTVKTAVIYAANWATFNPKLEKIQKHFPSKIVLIFQEMELSCPMKTL